MIAVLIASLTGSRLFSGQAAEPAEMPGEQGGLCLFLSGDVMTGRGIDQILPHSVDPILYEPWVRDARRYVRLAEDQGGEIPAQAAFDYIWGDALRIWRNFEPAVRLINLETSVTTSDEPWLGKQIHYRMHPENAGVLEVAGIDVASLANNHVIDWGRAGLIETVETLTGVGVQPVGAGRDLTAARRPVELSVGEGRSLAVIALGLVSSGIPEGWAASSDEPGIFFADEPSDELVDQVKASLDSLSDEPDVVIASIHWGGNWSYAVSDAQRRFAHALIERAGVDIVHGHSSHHAKGIEVYRKKLILYGCGDFVTDYEGISGHEAFRGTSASCIFPRWTWPPVISSR